MQLRNTLEYAVDFGKSVEMGQLPQQTYPFIYNFVHSNDDRWPYRYDVEGTATLDYMCDVGPDIAAGAIVDWPIRLDSDANFQMEWIRFSVWYSRTRIELAPQWEWYDMPDGWWLEQGDMNAHIGTPLTRFIKVGVTIKGADRYMYGAPDVFNQVPRRIMPVTLQGYDYGSGQVNVPYLCPSDGIVNLTMENTHVTKKLRVGGCIYGYKIKV